MGWKNWEKQRQWPGRQPLPFGEKERNPATGVLGGSSWGGLQKIRETKELQPPSGTYCQKTDDCGAGFACVDGVCTKVYTRGDNKFDSCGQETAIWPCEPPRPTKPSGCDQPGLGDCDEDPNCGDGPKCCRQQKDGTIKCWCADCEDVEHGVCNVWCDQYHKTWGVVLSGCHLPDDGTGDCGGNMCTECAFCDDTRLGFTGVPVCTKLDVGDSRWGHHPPCWCNNVDCKKCDKDENSSTFGEYIDAPEECCQACTQYNWDCHNTVSGCNKIVPVMHHCEPLTSGVPCISALRKKLDALCKESCKTEPDPCRATGSYVYCKVKDPNGDCDPVLGLCVPDGFSCPAGKVCKYTGYIDNGTEICYIYETNNSGELDDCCGAPSCNCHSDCGDCEICNQQGECEDDLNCVLNRVGWYRWSGTVNGNPAVSAWIQLTQNDVDNGIYLTLWDSFSFSQQQAYSVNRYGASVGDEWFAGPLTVTRKAYSCSVVTPGSPVVWYGANGNPLSSGNWVVGYVGGGGFYDQVSWVPGTVGCWSATGESATYDGGWEFSEHAP